MEVATKKIF